MGSHLNNGESNNVKYRRKKLSLKPSIMFISFGLTMIAIALFAMINTNNNKSFYKETTGVISDIVSNTTYNPQNNKYETDVKVYVDYEVDGKKYYDIEYYTYDQYMGIGDTVKVVYDTRNPQITVTGVERTNTLAKKYLIFGCIPLTIGVVLLLIRIKSLRKIKEDYSYKLTENYNNENTNNNNQSNC